MQELINKGIMAIVPEYVKDRGNCVTVYTNKSKPVTLEKGIKTVLRNLFKYYMVDLNETKKRYINLVSSPNNMPLPLSKNDIFIPLKTRKPICKNDGATGYINMRYLKKVIKNENSTTIQLDNNTNIECLSSETTVKNHLRNGNIVSKCYEERSMFVAENQVTYNGKKPILIVYEK
ncbi:MAG: competence protein ComK [Tissierellia bacterium]|nr:competence protein ComK [Tissierellia bacterium]